MADQIAQEQIAGSGIAGAFLRTPPTVAVTAPDGPLTTETVGGVTWTYDSVVSKVQVSYRVQVLNGTGSSVLYDSSIIAGDDTSFECPFLLSGGSNYILRVTVSDGIDSGSGEATFSANLETVADYPDNTSVGSVYEIGINGVGYMLADTERRPYRRSSGTLQAPRFATGDTPFSQAIERYSYVGVGDWALGAGQRMMDRDTASPRGFWESEGVDVFTPGELSLLNVTTQQVASALDPVPAVVASDILYVQTDTDELSYVDAVDGTPVTMTFTGDTVAGMASDGINWYVSNTDEEIFKGTDATIGVAWADVSAQTSSIEIMEWCSDRLAIAYTDSSDRACFSTLSPAGAEETAGGRFKHEDATITAITAGDGYVWYSVNRADRSLVYAWQLGSSDASFVALELPQGQYVTALYFYLGNVMVRAAQTVDATTVRAIIYRAVPSSGELTPERLLMLEDADVDRSVGGFVGNDRFVFFSWKAMSEDGRSGIGAIDLSTGGYAKWFTAPAGSAATGAVSGLFNWFGKTGFAVSGYGAVLESTTPVLEGYLVSSTSDLGSALTKVVDSVQIVTEPLPVGGEVEVQFSADGGESFTSIGAIAAAGLKAGEWELGLEGQAGTSKVVLTATVTSPVLRLIQYKVHALSIVDQVLELPINCLDRLVGLNGVEIRDGQPRGMARNRVLEDLVGTRIRLQDVDWPVTRVAEVWEVVATEFTSTGTYDRAKQRRVEQDAVCVLSLRRGQS